MGFKLPRRHRRAVLLSGAHGATRPIRPSEKHHDDPRPSYQTRYPATPRVTSTAAATDAAAAEVVSRARRAATTRARRAAAQAVSAASIMRRLHFALIGGQGAEIGASVAAIVPSSGARRVDFRARRLVMPRGLIIPWQ